jgi:hypothetical protein
MRGAEDRQCCSLEGGNLIVKKGLPQKNAKIKGFAAQHGKEG